MTVLFLTVVFPVGAVHPLHINCHVTYYCVSCHTLWEEVLSRCGTRDLCTSFPLRGIWQICASVQLECADQQAVEVSFPAFPLPVSTHTDPTMSSLSQALKLTCVVLVSLVSFQQNFLHCSLRVKWFDLCVYETGQHYESLVKHYERKCIFFLFHVSDFIFNKSKTRLPNNLNSRKQQFSGDV